MGLRQCEQLGESQKIMHSKAFKMIKYQCLEHPGQAPAECCGQGCRKASSPCHLYAKPQAIDSHSLSFLLNIRWALVFTCMFLRVRKIWSKLQHRYIQGPWGASQCQASELCSRRSVMRASPSREKSSASCCWAGHFHHTQALALSLQLLVKSLWPLLSYTVISLVVWIWFVPG